MPNGTVNDSTLRQALNGGVADLWRRSGLLPAFICCLWLAGCATLEVQEPEPGDLDQGRVMVETADTDELSGSGEMAPSVAALMDRRDLALLVSMTFDEAAAISPASVEVGTVYRVAADEIEILARDRRGDPTQVVARGRVFVELRREEVMVALAERAEVGRRALVLRGRPLLARGQSVLAGESGATFTVTGDALRVSGEHEVIRRDQLVSDGSRLLAGTGGGASGGRAVTGSYRIDEEFELPPLPSVTETPDPTLLAPPPELPELDEGGFPELPGIP